jgi:hypothetical protein
MQNLIDDTIVLSDANKKYKYDTKKYNLNFSLKNSAKIKEKVICPVCCGSYTYFNKSKHIRSKKHLDISEKLRQLQLQFQI